MIKKLRIFKNNSELPYILYGNEPGVD